MSKPISENDILKLTEGKFTDSDAYKVGKVDNQVTFLNVHSRGKIAEELTSKMVNKEQFMHFVVVSILDGLAFLHETKGIAVLNFDPAKILLGKRAPYLTNFDFACVFRGSLTPFPCTKNTLPEADQNMLYEPVTYYGSDLINPNYPLWWKADLFLLAIQLVLPLITGGQVKSDNKFFCPPVPLTEKLPGSEAYLESTKPCSHIFNAVFGTKEQGSPCNTNKLSIANWLAWHQEDKLMLGAEYREKDFIVAASKDRRGAFNRLFVAIARAHKDPIPCGSNKETLTDVLGKQIFNMFPTVSQIATLTPHFERAETPDAASAASAPASMFALLTAAAYDQLDLNEVVQNQEKLAMITATKTWRACKWVNLLIDLLMCPNSRQPASELKVKMAKYYEEECKPYMVKPADPKSRLALPCDYFLLENESSDDVDKATLIAADISTKLADNIALQRSKDQDAILTGFPTI